MNGDVEVFNERVSEYLSITPLLRPVTFCEPGVYRVGGIPSQENKVSSTASIFMSSS
jgi:hypothetical protein